MGTVIVAVPAASTLTVRLTAASPAAPPLAGQLPPPLAVQVHGPDRRMPAGIVSLTATPLRHPVLRSTR